MGGGGGGYDRPSGGGGSGGGSDDSDEDEPNRVPPPESEPEEESTEDQSEESNGSTEEPQEGSPPAGGGGDGTAPIDEPVDGPGDAPEGDDSEPSEEGTSQDEGSEEGEQGTSGESGDDDRHRGEESDGPEPTDSGQEEEQEDTDSERENQETDQQDREEEQEEDQEQESDDEDVEDEDDDREDEEGDDDENDEEDECLIAKSALLHSPNPEPLEDAAEGDICSVHLRDQSICIVDLQDRTIGAIAEPWVDTLKQCIEQGRQYRARILDIDGGRCEVRITNKCLVNRNVTLSSINADVRDQLHPELSLSVEATTEGVIVITADGTRAGNVPNPWARLLNECIDRGWSYQAEVRDVTPEYCTIDLQNDSIDE